MPEHGDNPRKKQQRPETKSEPLRHTTTGRLPWFAWIWFVIIVVVFLWLLGWGWGSHGESAGWGGKRQTLLLQPERTGASSCFGLGLRPIVPRQLVSVGSGHM